VKIKITCATVMLLVLADGSKFPPHVILHHKKVPKEQLHRVPLSDANIKVGWKNWLLVVWNRGPGDASL